jgi:FHA domain-containing protein
LTPYSSPPSVHDNAFGFDDLLSGPSHAALPLERKAPIIPEDFDPFATPSEAQRNSSDPLAGLSNDHVSLESLAGQNVTIDGLMSSAGNGEPALPDPLGLGPARSSETDPLALFASESILPTKQDDSFLGDIVSDHVSELNSHFAMPQATPQILASTAPEVAVPVPTAPPTPVPPPAPVPPPTPSAPIAAPPQKPPLAPQHQQQPAASTQEPLDPHALAEAFLRGANLPMDTLPAGVTLEWMEMMGRFAATATDGAVELIASRALVKREVKADLTMIVVRNNNPLKFLPDGHSALIQMLGKKIPGFMNPVEAMQDAYADLRAHQVGVVAGMRAALKEVLQRCDPTLLEKKLKTRALLDSLFAANRKAKMWDLYAELFKDIYLESQDDFQTLFGKAFLTAYESEIDRFHQRNKQ